jgi:hypothetical protein
MISLQWRGQSNPRRGVVNKRYLVKLSKQERKELSQLVKKERIVSVSEIIAAKTAFSEQRL